MRTFWQYLAEVKKGHIEKIGGRVNRFTKGELEEEPFNDVFGDKSRVVVPLMSEEVSDFLEYLEAIGLSDVNLKAGTATQTVQTKQGNKLQPVKIGKAVQQFRARSVKEKDEARVKESDNYLRWWEVNRDKVNRADGDFSVVISRHPIDIMRMSDHKGWSSCHSPGGSWWKCAVQEAKTGGGVAYVVRSEDLEQHAALLQKKELFADPDRKIDGVEPVARLRLRRFDDEDGNSYLAPEVKTYGKDPPGLYATVKQWALQTQSEQLTRPMKGLRMVGGSYIDPASQPTKMWRKFLGRKVDVTDKTIRGDGEKEDPDDRLQAILRGHNYNHFQPDASIEEGGGDDGWYVSYRGSVDFEFPADRFVRPVPEYGQEGYDEWSEVLSELKDADLDFYSIEDVGASTNSEKTLVWVYFDLRDEEDNGTLESLEGFLDSLDAYDRDYDDAYAKVEYELVRLGWLRHAAEGIEFQFLSPVEPEEEDDDGKKYRRVESDYKYKTQPVEVGNLRGLPQEEMVVVKSTRDLHDLSPESPSRGGTLSRWLTGVVRDEFVKDKFPGSKVSVEVEVKAGGDGGVEAGLDAEKVAAFAAGSVWGETPVSATMYVTAENQKPQTTAALAAIDKLAPEILSTVRRHLGERVKFVADRAAAEGYRPQYMMSVMTRKLEADDQPGEVYVAGGVYRYRDLAGGIDEPLAAFFTRLAADKARAKAIEQKLTRHPYRAWGRVSVRYVGGKSTFWWNDETNKYGAGYTPSEPEPIEAAFKRLNAAAKRPRQ